MPENQIYDILCEHKNGISEYDLLKILENNNFFSENPFASHLDLFRTHFLLYHYLYRLRSRLWVEKKHNLFISATRINIEIYHEKEAGIERKDPLMDYYLDITNLKSTTADDVDDLFESFWLRYAGITERQNALSILGLQDPIANDEIKLAFRKLVKEHHPDRGGDGKMIQIINEAMNVLLKNNLRK